MVLTNIRIWRDFIIARDSGIMTMDKELVKQSKKKQKSGKSNIQVIPEKVYEEKGLTQSSEETIIDMERSTSLFQQGGQYNEAKENSEFSKEEVILISSDSENESKSEPKRSDKELWKFRMPKKSSKYVPETKRGCKRYA